MAMTSELVSAINQISAERGIDKEEVFKALESAILSAVKKDKFGKMDKDYFEEESKLGTNLFAEVDR